jgi:hypothetical protein
MNMRVLMNALPKSDPTDVSNLAEKTVNNNYVRHQALERKISILALFRK